MNNSLIQQLAAGIETIAAIDAVYLYGSHAKNETHHGSDIDLGVLFKHHIGNTLDARMRPEMIKQKLEDQFQMEGKIDLVDVELVPLPLQYNIVMGKKVIEHYPSRIYRFENSIMSKWEETHP